MANTYPKQIENELMQAPGFVSETMASLNALKDLAKFGKPKTAAELQERLDEYFIFCKENSLKPGIESMALCIGIDRRTFWTWCNGAKGEEYKEICMRARQVLRAFIETSMYSGKINPAAAIFSLKNIAQWEDSVKMENAQNIHTSFSVCDLPTFDDNKIPNFSEVIENE